jgi:hypothetical protein
MADISKPRITKVRDLQVGVEYEGRPKGVSLPLVRGTFKKVIIDDGDSLAVFDPMFMGPDEYHLANIQKPEDWARVEGLYDYFPLRVQATKTFAETLTQPILRGQVQKAEKQRQDALSQKAIAMSELKSLPGAVDYEAAKARFEGKGGRRFTRKQCKAFKCKTMGFSQKASCRPYKNCYKRSAGVRRKKRQTRRK